MTDLDGPWLLLFDSIHHVLAAEAVFKERAVWCDLVPVPKDLSSDCGMAVAFRRGDGDAVRGVLAEGRVAPCRVYRPRRAGHEETRL